MNNQMGIKELVATAIKAYELNVNAKYLQDNLIALQELKLKNNQSYINLIGNADNGKITALGIINLSNKSLIFGKDFNIIPFKNKLTTIIDSGVFQKRMEQENWMLKRGIIYKSEKFVWDTDLQKPKLHEIDFMTNTSQYENIIGAYAFGINRLTGETKGILLRKADIDRLKNSSPSGNSEYSPWNKWPKEMVEAKLYRKLAQELGIDITDIDLDEKEIKEDGNFDYIPFNDITVAKNQGQISDEPLSNNINITPFYREIADTNNNIVKEDDISNVVPVVNNDEQWTTW
ncbi:recombinase RecT [Spiroplasma endosymbiont of Polydrusus formosus]|uniref:recombinase RecT n=1 Tax=Spiroplasma endosymbiont of Polydrusus formosus TaxID=3139326 RepID=UPI0035B55124